MACLKKVLKYFLAFIVLSAVLTAITEANRTPEDKARREKNLKHESELRAAVTNCQLAWEARYKRFMKDPNSLDWDTDNATVGQTKGKNPQKIVNAPFRAKNSYGGLTLDQAVCELEINTGKVVTVH